MQTQVSHSISQSHNAWSRDRIEYRFLVTLSFFLCLAAALIGRLSGSKSGEPGRSIFAQAKADAHAAIGYAFHG